MSRMVRGRVLASKASKRESRQKLGGLLPDAASMEALGWAPVDDSIHSIFAAAEAAEAKEAAATQSAGARRRAAALSHPGEGGGWTAVEPDSAALLAGATEGGFLSLEELSPELVFDAARLARPAKAVGKAAAKPEAVAEEAAAAPPAKKARLFKAERKGSAEQSRPASERPAKPAPPPAKPTPPPAADPQPLSKTRRRRLLRKKQRDTVEAPPTADPPPAAAAPPPASADGFEKPPSKRKRKRLAVEASAAAEAAAAAPDALPASALQAGWGQLGLHPRVMEGLAALGFESPTRIQQEAVSAALGGRDVIGAAATGSGKTLAFALPILQHLAGRAEACEGAGGLVALVICPTRELALQVARHVAAAGRAIGPRLVCALVGGLAAAKQSRQLAARPPIVVATPGRLWELVQAGEGHLTEGLPALRFLVLDEADRLVEKGHFSELERILDAVEGGKEAAAQQQQPRQTFVFSATLTVDAALRKRLSLRGGSAAARAPRREAPSAVGQLLERVPFARKPRIINACAPPAAAAAAAAVSAGAAAGGAAMGLASRLEEAVMEGGDEARDAALVYLLSSFSGRALVFCNAISTVRRVAAILAQLRIPCAAIHASQQQRQRLKALDRFSAAGGDERLALVATDVAARGLDIPGVRTVIHYQVAPSADVYVHRSGRTARAHAAGLAVTLVTPGERSRYAALCRAMGRPEGLPRFPADAAALAACARRAATAVKLDALVHAREKRAGDLAWARRHAAECDLQLSEEEEEEEGRGGERAGALLAPSQRELELRSRLDALLAAPLRRGEGGCPAAGSRKFPLFVAASAGAAAAAAVAEGPRDALDAVLAQQRAQPGRKKARMSSK